MKRILISTLLLLFGLGAFAQDYYYWYKEKKMPMELMPARKFILLASMEDTLALKNRWMAQNIHVYPFEVTPITGLKDKYIDKESDCWTIVEGENLPDFTSDELILYEVPNFKLTVPDYVNSEVCPSHLFYVKLFQADDFSALQNLATSNRITIRGNNEFMPLWYFLECSKESAGNALQMANLFYETGLFGVVEPELRTFGTFTTRIDALSAASFDIHIDTRNADNVIINAKNTSIDHVQVFGIEGRKIFEAFYSSSNRVNLNMSDWKGIYIFKVKLHSGDVIGRKTVIK
jgi:hypothetical protein